MRGSRSHSFHALTALASLVAAVMHSRASVRAWRTRPRMKCGGVWKKAHLFCNVAGIEVDVVEARQCCAQAVVCPLCVAVAVAVRVFGPGVLWCGSE